MPERSELAAVAKASTAWSAGYSWVITWSKVGFVVRSSIASSISLLKRSVPRSWSSRETGSEVHAARFVGGDSDEYNGARAAGRGERGADRGRYGGALEDHVEVPRRDLIRTDLEGAVYFEVPGPLQRAREHVGRHHFGRACGQRGRRREQADRA